jgi:hypothetical protein
MRYSIHHCPNNLNVQQLMFYRIGVATNLYNTKAGLILWPGSGSTSPANSPAVGSAQLTIPAVRLRVHADSSPVKVCRGAHESSRTVRPFVAPPAVPASPLPPRLHPTPRLSVDRPLGPRPAPAPSLPAGRSAVPSRPHSRGLKPHLRHGCRSRWQ